MYNNFVHVFLLVYKERLNVSYRRFVEIASEVKLQRMLCIKRIPHFTTLQKFMQKVPKQLFEKMVRACKKLLGLKELNCAIDSTGISLTNPSHHYLKRVDGVKVKNYVKTSLNVDFKHKIILDVKTHINRSHDTNDFIPLLKNLKNVVTVLADKAYDSTKNLKYVSETLKAEPQIPVREWKQTRKGYGHKPKINGKNRKKMFTNFNKTKYSNRNLVETLNSAIKRTLGSWVCSRKPKNQQKQVTIKALTYNLEIITRKTTKQIKQLIIKIHNISTKPA
jgi:IS5 family transposase